MTPRALLSLLFNGSKAVDVVATALEVGLLDALEAGPTTLEALSERLGAVPLRLYKLLDCLECLGFVVRRDGDTLATTTYLAVTGVRQAALEVVGPASQERDRDAYPWRELQGRLGAALTGEVSIPASAFAWPPEGTAQVAAFEASMAAGVGPAVEALRMHAARVFGTHDRLLDVGGGDGTLAAELLSERPELVADVYNLPAVAPLVARTRERKGVGGRLGFVVGDFLAEQLPAGYDVLSFVRVLHDWPPEVVGELLAKARAALPPGGRVLVCEEFRTPERLAAQFFWSYFLIGVDGCTSMLRTTDHYTRTLAALGFTDIAVLAGPFDVVVGVRGG